jgi:hypothetical protein
MTNAGKSLASEEGGKSTNKLLMLPIWIPVFAGMTNHGINPDTVIERVGPVREQSRRVSPAAGRSSLTGAGPASVLPASFIFPFFENSLDYKRTVLYNI